MRARNFTLFYQNLINENSINDVVDRKISEISVNDSIEVVDDNMNDTSMMPLVNDDDKSIIPIVNDDDKSMMPLVNDDDKSIIPIVNDDNINHTLMIPILNHHIDKDYSIQTTHPYSTDIISENISRSISDMMASQETMSEYSSCVPTDSPYNKANSKHQNIYHSHPLYSTMRDTVVRFQEIHRKLIQLERKSIEKNHKLLTCNK